MADRQIRVDLSFTADTRQAKQQLQDLKSTLNSLSQFQFTGANGINGITTETLKAGKAASQLKLSLEAATNVNTGRLNLTKFSQEMDRTGMSFKKYRDALLELGPEGAEAFSQLTDSVLRADSALGVGSKRLNDFYTTLKNTAKWQLTSNITHGLEGALQKAYHYAQDLNKSLNDIRIVTGYNTDQMAEFADNANRTAKNLSATTLDYTNASLIYYQQGLPEEQIAQRTETTIKMANVTGEAAESVSDYMTAVWNNFDDGSKSLEYYADVMTALGAATASSTDEIAQGLEKFAAVSETVGLSYEYATSALATVTSTTRQSADVVGTAFKTLFARIQGLELGETLEDGTTLNQYSEALAKVGINIKDSNGELKEMDSILNEMGQVWNTLGKAEQTALAQKVAGVRQYTQLIALMDNWGTFQENLQTAMGAEGALQDQADIYAESWQAAADRVQASYEGIFQSLIDDEAFIDILKAFEEILSFIDSAIDGLGGLKGVLNMVLAIATKLFSSQIARSMDSMVINLQSLTKKGRAKIEGRRDEMLSAAEKMNFELVNKEGDVSNKVFEQRVELQKKLLNNAENLTEEEKTFYQTMLDGNKALSDRVIEQAKLYDKIDVEKDSMTGSIRNAILSNEKYDPNNKDIKIDNFKTDTEELSNAGKRLNANKLILAEIKQLNDKSNKPLEKQEQIYSRIASKLENLKTIIDQTGANIDQTGEKTDDAEKRINGFIENLGKGAELTSAELNNLIEFINSGIKTNEKQMDSAEIELRKYLQQFENISPDQINNFVLKMKELINQGHTVDQALEMVEQQAANLGDELDKAGNKTMSFGQALTSIANMGSSMQMVANSLSGMMDAITDADMSGLEKTEAIFTSLISIMPALIMSYESFDKINKSLLATSKAKTAANITEGKTIDLNTLKTKINAMVVKTHPVMWIVTILMAVFSALTIINGALDANTQRIKENAESAREEAAAKQEELDKINELTKAYEKESEVYKNAKTNKEQMKQAALDLAKAYDDENLRLLAEAENYEKLAEEIKRVRIEKLKDAQTAASTAVEKTGDEFVSDMRSGMSSRKTLSGGYYAGVGSLLNPQGDKTSKKTLDLINETDFKYLKEKESDGASIQYTIEMDEMSKEELISAYEEIDTFVKELEKEKLTDSGLYTELKAWLDKSKESYTSYISELSKELQTTIDLTYFEKFENEFSNIDNYSDYETTRQNMIKSIADSQNIKEGTEEYKQLNAELTRYLSGIEQLSDYENTVSKFNLLETNENLTKEKIDEIEKYFNALPEEDKTLFWRIDFDSEQTKEDWDKKLAQLQEEHADEIGLKKAEGLGIDVEEFKVYRDLLRETTNDYDDNAKGLNEVVIGNMRLEKGVKSLAKDWKDFDEVMSDSNSSMEDIKSVLPDINEGLIDVLNVSKEDFELLPANFAQKNWSLIQDVMNNVEGAVDDLRDKAGEEILMTVNGVLDKDGTLKKGFEELHEAIASFDFEKFEVGMAIKKEDYQAFYDNCQNIIDTAGMTADEASAYFASMGYNVNFTKDKKKVSETVWDHIYVNKYDESGNIESRKVEATPRVIEGEVEVPVIETITPTGSYGGDINVKTTASPSMTSGKTKSDGGGSKPSKIKTSDETERYHEVNEELDDLNRKLDQMGKKSDKAFGAQKIAYMNKELKLLNKTIDAQKEKLSEIEKNLSTDQATLNQYGAKYDKEGRITNYDEMVAAETAKYNQAIDSGNEKTIELAEKRYENFKKSLEQYEETLNLLEEEEQNLQDYVDEKAELKLAKIQYTLEIGLELNEQDMKLIEYQLQKLENKAFSQAEKIVLYQQQTGILTNNAKLYEDQATSILKSKGLNKKEREAVLNGDYSSLEDVEFTQEEISALQTSLNGLMETNQSLYETNELIRNQLPESFDEWNEKIDETLERFEYYKALMGSFQDIVDILGAENLGLSKEFLRDMGWAQVAAANDEIESLTGHLQDLQTEEAQAREELSKATTEEDIEYWENIISDIEDRENQIQSSILSNTAATLEQIKALYDQAIDDTFAEFEDKIAGSFKSLEELNEAYERTQKTDEEYLADYKKLYELNKLNRDIEKSIDDTDSLKAKKALRELQAEIAEYEKDGVEMSQYDLEYMQKKYDLRLAEIALEEAQNAKSQVRLTRDASGNYSYTYTADQDQVDDATQKYNDALFAAQDLNETYIAEQTSLIPQYMTEMVEKTREIENRTDLNDEEKQEKIKETTDYYQSLIKTAGNNIEKGMGNNISLYQSEYEAFKAFNDGKQLAWDDFTTNFSQTTLSETLGPGFETLEGLYSNLAISIGSIDEPNSLLGKIKTHTDSYKTANDITLGLIGTSTENLAKTIATAILGENGDTTSISESLGQGITDFGALATAAQTATGTDDKTGIRGNVTELAKSVFNAVYGKDGKSGISKGLKDTKEQVNTLSTEASEDFTTLSTNVGTWQKTWNDEISKVITKNEALMKGYNDLIKSLAQTYKDPKNVSTNKQRNITENVIITKYETQGNSNDDNDDPPNDDPPNDDVSKNYKKYIHPNRITPVMAEEFWSRLGWTYKEGGGATILVNSYEPNKQYVLSGSVKEDYLKAAKNLGYTVKQKTTSPQGYYIISPTNPTWMKSFDTGGYTGAWGTAGKLAMLHEKELILNKWDTENILNVVSMVRELAKSIDFNAQLTSQGLGALSIAAAANPDHKLEQEVIIRAEFPGVRDRHEIEEAFTSLVNRATQFANRY